MSDGWKVVADDARRVSRIWWDLALTGVALIVAGIAALDPPYGTREYALAAVLAGFVAAWFVYGRSRVGAAPGRGDVVYTVILIAFVLAAVSLEPAAATLQTVVYPLVWVLADSMRGAIMGNVGVALAVVAGYIVRFGVDGVVSGLAVGALSITFSFAMGLWITRIGEFGEERARLLEELQAAQGELAVLHREAGVTSERARLAREIHDTIAQSLTGLVMVAQRTATRLDGEADVAGARSDIDLIETMARDALTEARGLVATLTPVGVDSTLAEALERLARSFERETGVRVETDVTGDALGRELEVVFLRCAQEGLANVRKHARATSARIAVEVTGDDARLTVVDDGVGPGAAVSGGGFGLAGMADRLELVGGRVSFASGPSGGATLTVVAPLSTRMDA
ncbi:sensor histidine kinase [Agromyces atrinae]|uniref:Sensor histidine kinase n=1 Tax=Agromyces atrinae TaxID=592376 RepID=A0A4Q2M6G7_9MICO|nr:sensor histidine kinase [Agromyces atrinae]NYD67261.1 signal transduction histidine kinase [Agromyces atrinae]RXZ86907.1 sensor histidine kinase [Agromyces atrinae]